MMQTIMFLIQQANICCPSELKTAKAFNSLVEYNGINYDCETYSQQRRKFSIRVIRVVRGRAIAWAIKVRRG